MKAIVGVVVALWTAASVLAAAPTSLSGKVYRESAGIAALRQSWEKTILFTDSAHYVYLKSAIGSTLDLVNHGKVGLIAPPADGTYVYTPGDTSATAVLTGTDGVQETLTMNFTTASGGTTGDTTFTVTDPTTSAPVTNVSLRGRVGPGQPLIAGFTIPGTVIPLVNAFAPDPSMPQREVLIRVVGPSLAKFGILSFWTDPQFQIYAGASPAFLTEVIDQDWSKSGSAAETAYRKIFAAVGAFPLDSGSTDAVAVLRLNPGSYTVVCNAVNGDPGGEALIEAYVLP